VTDGVNAQSAATVQVTVVDPNVVNAFGLTASVSADRALRWTDNASNERFLRGRALRQKKAGVCARSHVPVGGVRRKR
jgi:hypothetical protein